MASDLWKGDVYKMGRQRRVWILNSLLSILQLQTVKEKVLYMQNGFTLEVKRMGWVAVHDCYTHTYKWVGTGIGNI